MIGVILETGCKEEPDDGTDWMSLLGTCFLSRKGNPRFLAGREKIGSRISAQFAVLFS
jgi:hypothetical protein